jgi:SNF2 family DNA or RNA helicase
MTNTLKSKLDTTGLLEPQIAHAMKLLDSLYLNGIACDLSETGTGKTYAACWVAKQFNAPLVVICPKSVIPTWEKILTKFGVKATIMTNFEKVMRGGTPWVKYREPQPQLDPKTGQPIVDPKTGKVKLTEDRWRYQLVEAKLPAGCLVILDEAHKCKGTTSLNAGLMIALKRQGYKVLTLSATQATNPMEMRAFGYATNLHDLYSWKKWCLEHGAEEVGRWGAMTFDSDSEQAMAKMTDCHESLFDIQQMSSRLTREQMGALFPENQVVAEAFDLGSNDPKIQAVYEQMEYEIARLEEGTENYSSHVFAEIMKARRKAEMLKVPLFHDMFEDLYDERKSVVVFLNFTESIIALGDRLTKQKRFKNKIGYVYGEISFKQRWADIDAFNADKKRGLICNLKAGGASLSFHDLIGKYPRASLINPSFSAIDMLQALGRIHRQGGLTKCYQRLVFAANTIEEQACNRVQGRCNNLSCLVDGDLTAGFRIFH